MVGFVMKKEFKITHNYLSHLEVSPHKKTTPAEQPHITQFPLFQFHYFT